MAKLIYQPIGSSVNTSETWKQNHESMTVLEQQLIDRRNEVREGWGKEYVERTHKKGKLTAHERIETLADKDTSIFHLNTFVNYGEQFGPDKKSSPSAGIITAFVKVHNRICMVIANDNTVASGSWWPKTPEKIIRAQEIALKLKLPVIYLVDCSGLFLPEQGKTFPGKHGAGRIFYMNSQLSAAGIPQLSGVFGDCIAGGGYMPIISDRVYMTESAYMVIAGAALIKGAKSQHLSSLDIGGADIHVHLSNCADDRVPDDEHCIIKLREEVVQMASSAAPYYRSHNDNAPPLFPPQELSGLVPTKSNQTYDVREVIARLVDNSLFCEVMPHSGKEIIVGIAHLNGLAVGIAANAQELIDHPSDSTKKRPGGILYKEGVAKLSLFSRTCNDDGIPIIWLQDVSGFDVGLEAEKQGLLGFGSSLIYTNSTNQTPMITVLLRKASGAGYYAMAGLPYDPLIQLATPVSRLAVMEGSTLAIGAFNTKLDDNFHIIAKTDEERDQIAAGMKAVSEKIERDMDPYKAASQMDVDEIVSLSELRAYLECVIEACYQSQGTRRIKNPRIWSLHDLNEILKNPSPPERGIKGEGEKIAPQSSPTLHALQAFDSPMEGMFYRSPSPQDPPFVSEGSVVQPGDTVGLIEIMKSFYPLKYEGKTQQKIKTALIKDSKAVSTGEQLFIFYE